MTLPVTRPLLAITLVRHPDFTAGQDMENRLMAHFTGDPDRALGERLGVPVEQRGPGTVPPDFDASEITAVVVLADAALAGDPAWVAWVEGVVAACDTPDLRTRPFLVCLDKRALSMSAKVGRFNFLRWDQWEGGDEDKMQRMLTDLDYQCCRMLRAWISQRTARNRACRDAFTEYLSNVQLFLSHSKHDADKTGETLATAIRNHLHHGSGYGSFFDVHDIPAGMPFDEVLMHNVRRSAFLAILTDSYSSREWCRREVIEAKRTGVPMVVAHAVTDREERSFPYLGNVPVVRLEPGRTDRIPLVVGRLIREVLKDYLWQCRCVLARAAAKRGRVTFVPRTPELMALTAVRRGSGLVVYPDPPMAEEEARLFNEVAPRVTLLSFTQWLARA
ncbi:hypothetical protein J2848_006517 [Azospirillum lipoferum]|nr:MULTISPECIES: toll/interleukin-1 receptor domain-containing protein [Azospirillum]MCP1614809.1 hypothetical protein [Azospirillum lipoferum]MDW5532264.1 toll/interleukin-1 receptor domain-containing protein [Azospirillum sp. NL1]